MLDNVWLIRLFGNLRLQSGDREVVRFQTQKTGELLAYLAYHHNRVHQRDELAEVLWPDAGLVAGRNRLKQALASLRRHLEPPGALFGSVLAADRIRVHLNSQAVATDVIGFEHSLQSAARAINLEEKIKHLTAAVEKYSGDLLQGLSQDWVLLARRQAMVAYHETLIQLIRIYEQRGEWDEGIAYARMLVTAEPWLEEGHHSLIRLHAQTGSLSAAQRQYREYTRILQEELRMAAPPYTQIVSTAPAFPTAVVSSTGFSSPVSSPPGRSARKPDPSLQAAAQDFALAVSEGPQFTSPHLFPTPSIPVPLTRFHGREVELSRIKALVKPSSLSPGKDIDQDRRQGETPAATAARLVTLVGPGGVGKTRLAIEAARHLQPFFGQTIWYVPLSEATDPEQLPDAIIEALRAPRFTSRNPLEQIAAAVNERPSLLILDHFEQLAQGAGFLKDLLDCAPNLTCLLTSRRRLDIEGEQAFMVLPLPTPQGVETPDRLMMFASVRLFVDRAQSIKSDFQLTPGNAAAVAALSRVMEGVPLAIEMAAAWSHSLTPLQILDRLSDRFTLLVNRKSGVPARHQSMQTVLEESCRTLSPELRSYLAKLSVFRGSWTLSAAEQVCSERRSLDYLGRLQAVSLITAEETPVEMRFHMLETLREYVREQNDAAEQERLRQRHADYFLERTEQIALALTGSEQARWLEFLEQEQENLRAALEQHYASNRGMELLRLSTALWRYWWMRNHLSEGQGWLLRALATPLAGSTELRARALLGAAHLAGSLGDAARALAMAEESVCLFREAGAEDALCEALGFLASNPILQREFSERAVRLLQECVDLGRRFENRAGLAFALVKLGSTTWRQGDPEQATVLLMEGLDLYRQVGAARGISFVLGELSYVSLWKGEYAYADRLLEEKLMLSRQSADRGDEAYALWLQGFTAFCRGDYPQATSLLEESLLLRREIGDKRGAADALLLLGRAAGYRGGFEKARELLEESLVIRQQSSDPHDMGWSLDHLAWLALQKKEYRQASTLYERALLHFREESLPYGIADALQGLGNVEYALGRYPQALSLQQESLALRQTLGDRRGVVECVEGLALLCQAWRRDREAAMLLGAAEALRRSIGISPAPIDQENVERCLERMHSSLEEEALIEAWSEGGRKELKEILAPILALLSGEPVK